jgi:CheY-like chemotaxis protein
MTPDALLAGLTVLLVEDEAVVGMEIEFCLKEAGAAVIGPLMSVAEAVTAARGAAVDAAILDVDVRGQEVFPVADILLSRRIPFIFHTGHATRRQLDDAYLDIPVCLKPMSPARLIAVLHRLL